MLLFGIIQFGSVLFLHNNMVNAARETARRMAVDESFDAAQAQSYAETYLSDWNLTFFFAIVQPPGALDRTEGRRVGKECVSKWRSWWSRDILENMRNSVRIITLSRNTQLQ